MTVLTAGPTLPPWKIIITNQMDGAFNDAVMRIHAALRRYMHATPIPGGAGSEETLAMLKRSGMEDTGNLLCFTAQ